MDFIRGWTGLLADYKVIERIINRHSALFGQASVSDVSVFETASFNLVFKFVCSENKYVLKVMKKGAKDEFTIMQEAGKHISVPSPLSYGEIDDDEYLLMTRAPGKETQSLLKSMDKIKRAGFVHYSAGILAKLHRSTCNIHESDHVQSTRLTSVNKLDRRLTSLGIPNWQGLSTLQAMEPDSTGDICLVHGRYFPSNIMLDKSGITSVIDWSQSFWGSPLHDVGYALFMMNSLGLDAALFLRSYLDEWSKPVVTELNNANSLTAPDEILSSLPYYETLAAVEFYTIGIRIQQDPKLHEIFHSPQYAWSLKAIAAGEQVAVGLCG